MVLGHHCHHLNGCIFDLRSLKPANPGPRTKVGLQREVAVARSIAASGRPDGEAIQVTTLASPSHFEDVHRMFTASGSESRTSGKLTTDMSLSDAILTQGLQHPKALSFLVSQNIFN